MMKGHVLLSHGLESGPQATKVTAMAAAAGPAAGARRGQFPRSGCHRPVRYVDHRVDRLYANIRPVTLGLASASGPFASGRSLRHAPAGLYLPGAAIGTASYHQGLELAGPTGIVHSWRDELIP